MYQAEYSHYLTDNIWIDLLSQQLNYRDNTVNVNIGSVQIGLQPKWMGILMCLSLHSRIPKDSIVSAVNFKGESSFRVGLSRLRTMLRKNEIPITITTKDGECEMQITNGGQNE